jgi:hypothetical protein
LGGGGNELDAPPLTTPATFAVSPRRRYSSRPSEPESEPGDALDAPFAFFFPFFPAGGGEGEVERLPLALLLPRLLMLRWRRREPASFLARGFLSPLSDLERKEEEPSLLLLLPRDEELPRLRPRRLLSTPRPRRLSPE